MAIWYIELSCRRAAGKWQMHIPDSFTVYKEGCRDMYICDIHSHLLPGIDDGSPDWETTMRMLKASRDAGVQEIIATPHYLPWHRHNIAKKIPELCREAETRAKRDLGIDIRIYPGEELYYHRELPDALAEGRALTLANSRSVLVEFPEQAAWSDLQFAAGQLGRSGYQMILAHFERYGALRRPGRIDELLSMGVRIQSNIGEMNGGFWNSTRRWLIRQYREERIHFVGSDMHNLSTRPPIKASSLEWFQQNLPEGYRKKIFHDNALEIIRSRSEG